MKYHKSAQYFLNYFNKSLNNGTVFTPENQQVLRNFPIFHALSSNNPNNRDNRDEKDRNNYNNKQYNISDDKKSSSCKSEGSENLSMFTGRLSLIPISHLKSAEYPDRYGIFLSLSLSLSYIYIYITLNDPDIFIRIHVVPAAVSESSGVFYSVLNAHGAVFRI